MRFPLEKYDVTQFSCVEDLDVEKGGKRDHIISGKPSRGEVLLCHTLVYIGKRGVFPASGEFGETQFNPFSPLTNKWLKVGEKPPSHIHRRRQSVRRRNWIGEIY